jgi:hypothetical protein
MCISGIHIRNSEKEEFVNYSIRNSQMTEVGKEVGIVVNTGDYRHIVNSRS